MKRILTLIIILLFSSSAAFSESICEGASYYKWKNCVVKKAPNQKETKTLDEKENLTFYSIISARGEN